jgi:hypothetical protein
MSSHPGSTLKEAVELAEYLQQLGYMPEQVQDFYPTPSTISTCMYYTGLDPRTMEPVYVATNPHEKAMQRALIQYRNPANYDLVKEALLKAGREDLIGFDEECLILPRNIRGNSDKHKSKTTGSKAKSANKDEKPDNFKTKSANKDRKPDKFKGKTAGTDKKSSNFKGKAADADKKSSNFRGKAADADKKASNFRGKASELNKKSADYKGKSASWDKKSAPKKSSHNFQKKK